MGHGYAHKLASGTSIHRLKEWPVVHPLRALGPGQRQMPVRFEYFLIPGLSGLADSMRRGRVVTSGLRGHVVALHKNYAEGFVPLVVAAE